MNLRHLNIFKVVCEEGGITKAAKQLGMTQPAVSHVITELEDTLETKLFDRASRKIILNESGQIFLSKVIPLLDLYEDLETYSKELSTHVSLKVGCTATLARFLLPQIITKFKQGFPETPFFITVDTAEHLESKLMKNELDLALLEGVVTNIQLEKVPFSAYPLAVICSPSHPFSTSMEPVLIEALVEQCLLLPAKGNAVRDAIDSALLLHNISVSPLCNSSDYLCLIELAKQNLGISILPRIFIEESYQKGEISEVEVSGMDMSCVNHVVFKKDKFQTEAFQEFINFVLFQ